MKITEIILEDAEDLAHNLAMSGIADAGKQFWAKNRGKETVWEDEDDIVVGKDGQEYALSMDELEAITESEAWQKANKRDKTDGMSQKAVKAYRRSTGIMEIAKIPQSELGDWGEKGTLEPSKNAVQKKELPGGSGYTYAVDRTGKGDLEIMIFDGDKLAAELDLFETQDVLGTWGVETVVVERPYRGQGLGKALYGIALSILKLTIEAGETQTKFGQQMWLMLSSIPGVEVLGYAMESTDRYRPRPGDQVVDKNDTWTRYTFPVEPGRRSMRSTRSGTGIYSSQYVSMIARWTGR